MAQLMQTLREIAAEKATKMPQMVDSLTEEAPILDTVKWTATTHGLWNVTEEITDIQGAGFTKLNAPLPKMDMATALRKVDLEVMGGEIEVPEDKAIALGGAPAYFAKRQPKLLRKAGNDTEVALMYRNWLPYAVANKATQVVDAGGIGMGCTSIVVVRLDTEGCTGLYDSACFDQGTLLKMSLINNGALYHLHDAPYKGVLGYGARLKGYFGWQLMDKRCVSAIVNIKAGKEPTAIMIDDMLAAARASAGNTFIFCHPKTYSHYIAPLKMNRLQMQVKDTEISTVVDKWNGIKIVTSHNLLDHGETAYV